MNKKRTIIIALSALGVIAIIISCILLKINKEQENKIKILDATYTCEQSLEKFYEDQKNIYYFTCVKSNSVYVKFPDGNKKLVVTALEEELVTIDELLEAGLEVYKKEK